MNQNNDAETAGNLKQQVIGNIQKGAFGIARDTCGQLCKQHPEDAEAWFLLGAINGQLENWPDAEQACRNAARLAPHHPMSRYNLAVALLQQEKPESAIAELLESARLQPTHIATLLELGNAYALTGRLDLATLQFTRVIELDPNSASAHLHIAHAYRDREMHELASVHYKRVIDLDPDNTEAYCELAGVLIATFKFDRAIALLESVIPRMPGKPRLHLRLASAYQEQGDSDYALRNYEKALELSPDNITALTGIASIQALQGDFSKAFAALGQLIAEHPENHSSLIAYANIAHHFNENDRAIELIDERLADQTIGEKTRSKFYFALASIHERKNDLDVAFEYYKTANRLRGAKFDYASYTSMFDALMRCYSQDIMPELPRSTCKSDTPVFIVGMPRSGTSLAEQIIASHPAAYGAGELRDINYLVSSLAERIHSIKPYPLCLDQVDTTLLDTLAGEYLAETARRSGNARFVTDKMPGNFMHLGFIDMLFPNARVIHCTRDPLDTCLSCYFQSFSGELPYTYSLTDLGKHYRLYLKLMNHWKKVLRIPVYELNYETLVSDQETETRKLLDFCGIEWNDACLDFHKTRRTVSTASYSQVRKPMYTKSVGRWKAFEKHLGPLIEELGKSD